jgi:hypothetical protein
VGTGPSRELNVPRARHASAGPVTPTATLPRPGPQGLDGAELAATKARNPQEVLRSLKQGKSDESLPPHGPASHSPAVPLAAQVVHPASMDDHDWAMTEAKGWTEVTIRWSGREKAITFYDPTRQAQEVQDAMTQPGYFAERAIAVVPAVTREAIEAALALMAQREFADVG